MNRVKVGFFSLSGRGVTSDDTDDDTDDRAYLAWHQLDHMPEQYQLPGIVHGQRWVSNEACHAARSAASGVFDDVHHVVASAPMLCAPGATVLWTRHRAEPDLTPSIRRWFAEAGFDEVGFDAPDDVLFGVGAARLAVAPPPLEAGVRLFTFVGDGSGSAAAG